jgi:hypothetical protein
MQKYVFGLLFALTTACQGGTAARSAAPANGFDRDAVGALPAGWRTSTTGGQGQDARWIVQADSGAASAPNTLALIATNHDLEDAFNLCWTDGVRFRDGRLAVAVRADHGEADQGGGLAWRIQDADNYYVCRYNPLEANYRVYVVTGGVRRQLATALVQGDGKGWHALEVEHRGAQITCWLDGRQLLAATDARLPAAGGIGFWTKADARTSFDDLAVDAAPE